MIGRSACTVADYEPFFPSLMEQMETYQVILIAALEGKKQAAATYKGIRTMWSGFY